MLLANMPPASALRIKEEVLTIAGMFRSGDILRMPCEEVVATAVA